jgi:hypothetical protein
VRDRWRAAVVIGRRQALETLATPGFYVTLAAGLALGLVLVAGFTRAVDSAGFAPGQNGLWALLARGMAGAFGEGFVEKAVAEGPFAIALLAGYLPVGLFLSISSVLRFSQERSAGAIELLVCGPADGMSYCLASFLRDAAFSAAALAALAGFFLAAAAAGNLSLGPLFGLLLPVLLLLTASCSAWGILAAALCAEAAAALAAHLGVMALFLLMLAGSYSVAAPAVRSAAAAVSAALQWVSPFYYASLGVRASRAGAGWGSLGALALQSILAVGLLALCRLAIGRRGVRP